jgi:PST family polysaccharide transporter
LAARALALVTELGDYVVLGRFHPDAVVGIYYFAFNLSLQTAMVLALNLDGVLMPVLSKLKGEPVRQREAFLSAARAIALVGIPVCLLQAVVAGPAIRLVFDPKWYAAIPVLQVLSAGMSFRVVTHPAQSLMRAQGRFATLTGLNGIGAATFLGVTTAAAARGSQETAAVSVAAAVAAFFALEGPIYFYAAVRRAGGSPRDMANVYGPPLIVGAVASGGAILTSWLLPVMPGRGGAAVQAVVTSAIFTAAYVAGVRLLMPSAWHDLVRRIKARGDGGETFDKSAASTRQQSPLVS